MEKNQLIDLVTRAKAGDSEAVNELFTAFYGDVYYFALKTVKDSQVAEDVTQETFVEIINTLGGLNEPAAFVSWMKQITYHQCTRYFKKKKDVIVDEDEDGYSVFDTIEEENAEFIPDEALDKKDFKATVLSMLDELSPEQHTAIMLYYFDELSVGEIAKIQGVSEGTVKSRLNYGRKAIKEAVTEYEKKNGIKLHSIPFIPLVLWLFKGTAAKTVPLSVSTGIAEGVSAATGTAVVGATAAAGTVAGGAAATAATAASGLGLKIAAIAVAATVAVGGVGAAGVAGILGITSLINSAVSSENGEDDTTSEVSGYIIEGMTYTTSDGTVLTEGDPFPENCTEGDRVDYRDYVYIYEGLLNPEDGGEVTLFSQMNGDYDDNYLTDEDLFEAWHPMVADLTKESYEMPLAEINHKPIKGLFGTYSYCTGIKNTDWFNSNQENLTYMVATFFGSSVEEATNLKIPVNATNLTAMFAGCSSLEYGAQIPEWVDSISGTYMNCTALTHTIAIDCNPEHFEYVFSDTEKPIGLVGKSNMLAEFAATAENGNVTVGELSVDNGSDDENSQNEISYTVPVGFTYKTADGQSFSAGEIVTSSPILGDSMTDGIYLYQFGKERGIKLLDNDKNIETEIIAVEPGWSVYAVDTSLESYPDLLSSINGQPLEYLSTTFLGCKKLQRSPAIPSTVTRMDATFAYCEALTVAPVLPASLEQMKATFYLCSALTSPPEIPQRVWDLSYAFFKCSSISVAPTLPDNAHNISNTFQNCAITTAPTIPSSVTYMSQTFLDCSNLTAAPEIPQNVQDLLWCFGNCTSLSGTVRVRSTKITDPEQMRNILYGTTKRITLFTDCEYWIVKKVASDCGSNVSPRSSLGVS